MTTFTAPVAVEALTITTAEAREIATTALYDAFYAAFSDALTTDASQIEGALAGALGAPLDGATEEPEVAEEPGYIPGCGCYLCDQFWGLGEIEPLAGTDDVVLEPATTTLLADADPTIEALLRAELDKFTWAMLTGAEPSTSLEPVAQTDLHLYRCGCALCTAARKANGTATWRDYVDQATLPQVERKWGDG